MKMAKNTITTKCLTTSNYYPLEFYVGTIYIIEQRPPAPDPFGSYDSRYDSCTALIAPRLSASKYVNLFDIDWRGILNSEKYCQY